MVILMIYWMGNGLTAYNMEDGILRVKDISGFSWSHADLRVFNWHPLFMTFGLVFCVMQASLAYISLPFSHAANKRIHLSLHALGILSAALGAVAVFRYHNEHGITNLYSLHSWLGLTVLILLSINWLVGFAVFFYPGAKSRVRELILPYHIGIGLSILGLVVATVEAGIMEKLTFNSSCNVNGKLNGQNVKGFMAPDCVLGNIIGLLVALSFISILITIWHAKHQDSTAHVEEEVTPLLNENDD